MGALIKQIALVCDDGSVDLPRLSLVAAAIQKQVSRDFGPLWNVQATINAFDGIESAPDGYWNIVIRGDIGQDVAGYHSSDDQQPFSLVRFGADWEITCSHECLEMLADPFGNQTKPGDSLLPGTSPRVDYLVEVCDPCPNSQYTINGISVSDFVTPNYFDPIVATGVRYSFTSGLSGPRELTEGGYLTFHDTQSGEWYQVRKSSGKLVFADFGPLQPGVEPLRAQIDTITRNTPTKKFRRGTAVKRKGIIRRRGHHVLNAIERLIANSSPTKQIRRSG
jgi:hypothetical protein